MQMGAEGCGGCGGVQRVWVCGGCGGMRRVRSALTSSRCSRYSPTLMSVLCSGGSLGSKPASFLILAMASFSDLASTTSTTRSEMINRLEGSMLRIVEGALADRRVEQITVVYSCNSKSVTAFHLAAELFYFSSLLQHLHTN